MGAEGRGAGTRAEETALFQGVVMELDQVEKEWGAGGREVVRFEIEFEGRLFVSLIFVGALRERLIPI